MKLGIKATFVCLAIGQASAHMEMTNPPPLRSKHNPNSGDDIDFSYTAPLSASGSDYPCKGTLKLLGTDKAKPVANYTPGQQASITIEGGASHNGGSCQISLSYDQGKTFTAIQTIVGNCPLQGKSDLPFTIPTDAPSGNALLAWTWYNRVGNRELYMNCASVTVGGGGGGSGGGSGDAGGDGNGGGNYTTQVQPRQASSFSSRPPIFLANIGNGCKTAEGSDLEFPNPGPDMVNQSDKTSPPVGSCAAAAPATGGSDAGSGNDGGSPAPDNGGAASSPAPAADATSPAEAAPPAATSAAPPAGEPSESLPGGVFVTQPPDSQAPQPTTLATATSSPATSAPSDTEPAASDAAGTDAGSTPPAPSAPSSDSGSGSSPDSGSATGAQTGACSNEGIWNCLDGKQYQRCASGQWSVVMPMAAGTSCSPGESTTLFAKKRLRFMRW